MATSIYDLSLRELEALFREWDQPAYRAKQVYQQLYVNLADSPAGMTSLPTPLRRRLAEELPFGELDLSRVQTGDGGQTRKAVFLAGKNAPAEAVLMIYRDRATVCVSTQSGCAVDCSFCATGTMGFRQNLTTGQMIEQVLWAVREMKQAGGSLTNVVYMGMGEPFLNYDRWWASVERLHDPAGLNLGARAFTVSTVGVVPGIRRLACEKLPVNLAVSLHAADDALRTKLVPLNKRYPVAAILEAVREYTEKTRRRVSFEYVLLKEINDGPAHAERLAKRLKGLLCHVNLIPWNPVPGVPLDPARRDRVLAFQKALEKGRIACTIRVQRGVDIAAACGQLAGGRP